MTNEEGTKLYINQTNDDENKNKWESIEPTTVQSDEELQAALNGEGEVVNQDDRTFNPNASEWGGMNEGAIQYPSTQSDDWLKEIPLQYKKKAGEWIQQQGVLKITPKEQRQKFTYSTVAYIASKQEEPKTQIFPISDVQVTPHQITFDFYDTTEGRIGVSNAVEKHMSVEFDVYLTDLLAQYWIFGENDEYNIGLSELNGTRKEFWESVDNGTYLDFEKDLEQTKSFVDFRNTFLQQHSGWVCKFSSHTFGIFTGVITDVNYSIGSGESFAKWHVKLEEAVFMKGAYSRDGKKQESTTSETGSTTNSGSGIDAEDISTSVE